LDKLNKLVFYNKDGYPYNFEYNDGYWNGKIIFDHNSSELFKTIGLYIFEKVEPINISTYCYIEPSQLFNYSGITFLSKTKDNLKIENIKKSNNDPNFYTKWIYGKNFDIYFKPRTIVTISGNTNDFNGSLWYDFINNTLTYFNVLLTKKNAILIETLTKNSDFNNFIFETGLTISSHNIMEIPDYGNERLVNLHNLNFYNNKKLSIINSKYNDGIYTYKNYSILKNQTKDFRLIPETTGKLIIDITLFTDRPKIYSGNIQINISNLSFTGTTIIFENYINYNIDILNSGQTIIFEDINGDEILTNNPEFKITGFKDKELLLIDNISFENIDDRYFIFIKNIDEIDNLTYADQLYLESYPLISGTTNDTMHNNRLFDIISIDNIDTLYHKGIKIEVNQYVINENVNIYKIYKKLRRSQINTIYAQTTYTPVTYSGYSHCFLTTNKVKIEQEILPSGNTMYFYENTINAINLKYSNYLKDIGIELIHFHNLNISDNNYYNYLIINGLYDYNFNPFFDVNVYINNNQLSYDGNFDYISGSTCQSGRCDSDVFYFETYENIKNELIRFDDINLLNRNFYCQIEFDIKKDLMNYGFNININNANYYINYNQSTDNTIQDFIYKYNNIFNKLGLELNRNNNILEIIGIYPNIEIINLDVNVNIYSSYNLTKDFNKGVILSSDQIVLSGVTIQDLELSTGMIITINDSEYNLNNKDYNILKLENDNIIQLSYQGPLFGEEKIINIETKEFLRKPRSYYNKDIEYKFYWEDQTDDIFFYDFSGDQLKPYNDIKNLEYIGIKPLYSNESNKKVFLNKYPNKKESCINDPSCQQTVFDELVFPLEKLNSSNFYNYIPIPLEIFIGFNSKYEGVSQSTLIVDKIENCQFSGYTDISNNLLIYDNIIEIITNNYIFNLYNYGFEQGQFIEIEINDISETGQTIYLDYEKHKIKNITPNKIFTDDKLINFSTTGKTYFFNIKVKPKTILKCKIFGQTEIEDERFDINLRNLGIDIYKDAEFIFKESDINEESIDFTRLNRKRKEMLSIYTEIFNYIGSYKSLIHSIDFFGYNDLQLYEYYRNIKSDSPLYGKLYKILVSDIFSKDDIKNKQYDNIINGYDKGYYKKTNLFNLTYNITDEIGNYNLQYSLDDVQIKLNHLVKWLRKNIIPLSSNILDITGVANNINNVTLKHDSSVWTTKYTIDQNVTAVNFYYTTTKINNNSYLIMLDFYIIKNEKKPEYFTVKIKTYSLSENNELLTQQNILLNKSDYDSYSFTINDNIDPYISIEITTFNDYGVGYMNSKMFKYNEKRIYYLINSNFNNTNFDYLDTSYGYYIINNGKYYLLR